MILNICPNPSIDSYAWLDDFQIAEVNRISELKDYPGGKGIHVGLAIKELGSESEIFGTWAGGNGAWIREECEAKGVRTSGISIEGNNRKCYTFRSQSETINNTEILEPGPKLNPQAWEAFKREYTAALQDPEIICLSGSWPKGAPSNAYRQLIELASENGKKCILDASGIQLRNVLDLPFFGLHLNEDEARELCGSTEIADILEKIKNVELIALTKGKEGLVLYYQGKILEANTQISNVISTVGSGDCLTAGIAYAVSEKMDIKDIASWGVACGAANCIYEDLGMIRKADVTEILKQITIKEIT